MVGNYHFPSLIHLYISPGILMRSTCSEAVLGLLSWC